MSEEIIFVKIFFIQNFIYSVKNVKLCLPEEVDFNIQIIIYS